MDAARISTAFHLWSPWPSGRLWGSAGSSRSAPHHAIRPPLPRSPGTYPRSISVEVVSNPAPLHITPSPDPSPPPCLGASHVGHVQSLYIHRIPARLIEQRALQVGYVAALYIWKPVRDSSGARASRDDPRVPTPLQCPPTCTTGLNPKP